MWLRLQPDSHMLYGSRKDRVSESCKGTSQIVLAGRKACRPICVQVPLLKSSSSVVESAELYGDTGTYAYQGRKCAFVEC